MQILHYQVLEHNATKLKVVTTCYYIIVHAAPSGPPQLVSVQPLSPTSLLMSWDPPLQELWNGIIQQYMVRIIELETERVTTLFTETTTVNVTSLHPYYNYNCTVAAETTSTGPFSSPVIIRLPESGMSFSELCFS